MPYKNMQIYFTSGTGNTYQVAKWILELAESKNISTELHSIENSKLDKDHFKGKEKLFGFGAPAHGFSAPWHMLKFMFRLPRSDGASAFSFSTRGSFRLGNTCVPGLSGSAIFLFALILFIKGYKVKGGFTVDMPINWQNVFPSLKKQNIDFVLKKAKIKILKISKKLLSGKSYWLSLNNIYEFLGGILLSWFTVLYIYIGRAFMAKIFFENASCTKCGLCVKNCPVSGLKFIGSDKKYLYWTRKCESCMRCMAYCPNKAIEASHSWGALIFGILWLPTLPFIMNDIIDLQYSLIGTKSAALVWIISTLLTPLFIYLFYYLLHYLSRFPTINKLLKYTTLTPLYRRYHAPNIKTKDLTTI
ncbi:MAG: EFR1 family ferrodoxin [Pseudomonadota bacterium]